MRRGVTRTVDEARLVAEIALVLVGVRRRLRRLRLPVLLAELRRGLEPGEPAGEPAREERAAALRLGRAVGRTLPHLPGDTRCLTQALVLTAMLARRRIRSSLLIAVAPGEDFRAHAWVEHRGVALLPADGPGFGRLVEL